MALKLLTVRIYVSADENGLQLRYLRDEHVQLERILADGQRDSDDTVDGHRSAGAVAFLVAWFHR